MREIRHQNILWLLGFNRLVSHGWRFNHDCCIHHCIIQSFHTNRHNKNIIRIKINKIFKTFYGCQWEMTLLWDQVSTHAVFKLRYPQSSQRLVNTLFLNWCKHLNKSHSLRDLGPSPLSWAETKVQELKDVSTSLAVSLQDQSLEEVREEEQEKTSGKMRVSPRWGAGSSQELCGRRSWILWRGNPSGSGDSSSEART